MSELKISAEPFQFKFLNSKKRYPALVAGVGTGKTLFALLKVWNYCQEFSSSLFLVVRKEFTDLRDSTIKDFIRYFEVSLDTNKEFHFKNKSCIMFRHGAELEVLKNLNLSGFMIEQAEEFESEETFMFLRDRLRRENAPYRQGILIANTNGHNWIFNLWKSNPPSEDYDLTEANTFDNKDNLPKDFILDLEAMEKEAPSHYKRYVLNSWEETDEGDLLIPFNFITDSIHKDLIAEGGRLLSVDVARFGEDETVFSIIQKAVGGFKQIYLNAKIGIDLMQTVGMIVELKREYSIDMIIVDADGLGGGVVDRLNELEIPRVYSFKGAETSRDTTRYWNKRAESYDRLRELFQRGQINLINDEVLKSQLSSIKFKFKSNGAKIIESKDDMLKRGIKSPDRADALMMGISLIDQLGGLDMKDIKSQKAYMPQHLTYTPSVYKRKMAHAI